MGHAANIPTLLDTRNSFGGTLPVGSAFYGTEVRTHLSTDDTQRLKVLKPQKLYFFRVF